jgi:hypothetical protein
MMKPMDEQERTHRLLVKQYNALKAMTVGEETPEVEAYLADLAEALASYEPQTSQEAE